VDVQVTQCVLQGGERHDYKVFRETPSTVLSREYRIEEFALVNNTFHTFYPFRDLFNNGSEIINNDFTKSFMYFRSDLRLRFFANTTITDIGCYVISWIPDCAANMKDEAEQYGWINADPVIVGLSSQQQVEMVIPWTTVSEWIRLEKFDSTSVVPIQVNVFVMCYRPLQTGAATPKLQVFAQFVNPEVTGSTKAFSPPLEAQSQSGRMTALRDLDGSYYNIDLKEAPAAERSIVPYVSNVGLNTALTVGAASGLDPTGIVQTLKMVKTGYDLASFAANHAKSAYDWYKGENAVEATKETEEPSSVRNQAFGNISGCVYNPSLQLGSHISTYVPPIHVGDSQLKHGVLSICKTPAIVYAGDVNVNGSGIIILPYEPGTFTSGVSSLPYYEMMSTMFKFWRGSIKVRFHIFSSPLLPFELKIMWVNPYGVDTSFSGLDQWVYREMYEIRGDKVIDILLPYIAPTPWRYNGYAQGSIDNCSKLYITTISPPRTFGASAPNPYMLVSMAAGDDFQLKDLQSCNADKEEVFVMKTLEDSEVELIAESQMHLRSTFSNEFKNFTGGGQPRPIRRIYEDTLTVEDILNRFSTRPAEAPFELFALGSNTYEFDNFDYIVTMFRYVRGSFRIKHVCESVTQPRVWMHNTRNKVSVPVDMWAGNGVSTNFKVQNSVIEFEVPFMCDYDWYPVPTIAEPEVDVQPTLVSPTAIVDETLPYMIAAGTDFQLAYLMPPYYKSQYLPGFAPVPP